MRPRLRHRQLARAGLAAVIVMSLSTRVGGQTAQELQRELKAMKAQMQELQAKMKKQEELINKLVTQQGAAPPPPQPAAEAAPAQEELEAEIRAAMPPPTPPSAVLAPVAQPAGPGVAKSSSILNPDISFNGDFTFLGTNNNQLNKANEFSFREAEIGFQAPIDPYARADAFISIDEDGTVDIEEAYATFLTLPFNLQTRAGKFRLMFGKNNPLHLHALPQTDRPFVEVANFGEDGFAGTGVEMSYLVPNPWDQYLLLTAEVVNNLDQPGGGQQGAPLAQPAAGRVFRDFAFLGHAQSFFDLNADNNIELGASALFNLPKSSTQTRLYGVDLTYRWRPLGQAGYRQFLWRTEGYFTNKDLRGSAAALLSPGESNVFNTAGFYTYGEYRLAQRWWLGTRVDWTEIPATRTQTDWGVYPYVTFAPTEFGYFRLGYEYAEQDQLQNKVAQRVWLQYDFSIGPHAAHPF
jgi:hypothetical protein